MGAYFKKKASAWLWLKGFGKTKPGESFKLSPGFGNLVVALVSTA